MRKVLLYVGFGGIVVSVLVMLAEVAAGFLGKTME